MRRPVTTSQLKTVADNRGGPRKPASFGRPASGQGAGKSIITVRVPMSTQQRGVRKLVVSPPGEPEWAPRRPRIDDTLIKAIARAHRWNRILEQGEYASVTELANAEDVTESYLARVLRLTLLSPRVVEAVLDGKASCVPQLERLVRPFSMVWQQQESRWLP